MIMTTQTLNWETAVVVTTCLKEAITDVVKESFKKPYETLLSETKESCSQCCLDTLMPLHIKGDNGCPLKQKHCNCLNAQRKTPCPSKFCTAMYDEIIEQHRFRSPNWKTTDIKQWYTNIWEVAKCFIPKDKCIDELEGQDRECIELLYVSINNVAVLSSSQVKELELLTKIKNAQEEISNLKEIEESQMNQYITDVTDLLRTTWLQDSKNRKVNDALNKISQMASSNKDGEEKTEFPSKIQEQETATLDKNQQNTNTELNAMKKQQYNLEKNHSDLKESHIDLKESHKDLKKSHDALAISVSQLNKSFKELTKNQSENQSIKEGETEESAGSVPMKSECEETPVISRPLDGRLITLDNKQIDALMKVCETKEVLKGGFGSVYVSKSNVPELDVRVVIKKITCKTENDQIKKLSTLNEKIAARVMHFAIVPLIAYAEQPEGAERAYYFLSPYLEKESLRVLIASDRMCSDINDVMMKYTRRIQILFQIASALNYLHTPVPGYRGIILHMDVTTMNIVCDKHFNARLIDFGLAREMNEGKQEVSCTRSKLIGTQGYFQTERNSILTVHEDYYNFGVVIRELLTGDPPYTDNGSVNELRKFDKDDMRKAQQKLVWKDGEEYAQNISQLSERCLKSKKLTSTDIVKELKNILNMINYQWTRPEANKCDLCMVNVTVEDGKAPPHECKMKICVSCMRNSHINPIRCPTCNEEVTPEIGHTFAALLIAGNDQEELVAESFRREIFEIKGLLASKYPCVMGIRDENIITITPSKPGKEETLLKHVQSAFESFQTRNKIKTLLIYFAGHHNSKSGFMLGCSEDVLPTTFLQENLEKLCTQWNNKTRILVFLNCCEPQSMSSDQALLKTKAKIIQLNVCRQDDVCFQKTNDSLFHKFFVQALTRKIYNKECFRIEEGSGKVLVCEDCEMTGDFISAERLLEYMTKHMEKCVPSNEPVLFLHDVSYGDSIIGYNVDFALDLSFKFEVQPQEAIDVKLDQEMYCDIDELKLRILQKVTSVDRDVKLSDKFADAIMLRIHTGSVKGKELSTMLQVNAAMNAKREIIASYRSVTHIVSGRVAMFTPTGCIYRYFDEKSMLKKTGGGRKEANLSLKDLDQVTDVIQGQPDLKTLHETLFAVYKAWKKEKNKEEKELKVIFPCTETENGNHYVVLDLAGKGEGASSNLTN